MAVYKFDSTQHDTTQRERGTFENIPDGNYILEVDSSEVAPTKDSRGRVLKVVNVVIEPEEFAGQKVFNNYNVENPSAKAQQIGQEQLSALCRAIGITEFDDTDELHLKPYTATIMLGKPSKETDANGNPKYAAKPEISRYWFPDEGNVPAPEIFEKQSAPAPAPAESQAPANNNRQRANDNRPAPATTVARTAAPARAAPAAAAGGARRPWGK